jgi:hypothetical protein
MWNSRGPAGLLRNQVLLCTISPRRIWRANNFRTFNSEGLLKFSTYWAEKEISAFNYMLEGYRGRKLIVVVARDLVVEKMGIDC